MNLILLSREDFTGAGQVRLAGRRLDHVRLVHKPQPGQDLRVGILGGRMGTGRVMSLSEEELVMEVTLSESPPPPPPITLVLALPRPKVLNRAIAMIASLGVKEILLINSWRVEKSYWKSPNLAPENLHHQLCLGLEQARDTILPTLRIRRFFREFLDEDVPILRRKGTLVLAHPDSSLTPPITGAGKPLTLVIGPEGGFIENEVGALIKEGFQPLSLGPRILRVETAIPFLVSRLTAGGGISPATASDPNPIG